MTFYLVSGPPRKAKEPKIPLLMQDACEALGIDFSLLDTRTVNLLDLPKVANTDMIYRSVMSKKARVMEKLLLPFSSGHIYTSIFSALSSRGGSYFHHRSSQAPVVPTVPFLPDSNDGLKDAAELLEGFPLIVKVTGGTLGVGVMRIDSLESLISVADYLRSTNVDVYLRKYIEHEFYVRAVVLGGRVIASHRTYALPGEFRTNVGDSDTQHRESFALSDELQHEVVDAVTALELEFAGVDILFDMHGGHFITEVNSPFDFACTQEVTGVDIALGLVSFLQEKARSTLV